MRRFEESQEDDFRRYVKIGQDNADCLSKMQRWCKHVEIERTSEGLYAQMTGLPIAGHSVACPKVEGKMGSMNLRWIFSDFLVKHCAACPHHAPNGDPSWGQGIIDKHREEVQKQEKTDNEEADRIAKLRSELRSKFRDISWETEPQSHQILEYLEAIFSKNETKRIEASERLKQSAHLGADLFPNAAIDFVLHLAGTNDFSESMLPVCMKLAKDRPELGSRFSRTALDNIENGLHPELSASVLSSLGNFDVYPLSEACIEQLLLSQGHYRSFPYRTGQKSNYPHSTSVLVRSFDADPESVRSIVRRELQNESDDVRFQLCGAIKLIQNQRPQFVENLLDDLVQSLELREVRRSSLERPSGQIVHILESVFRYSANKVDSFLAESMTRVRPAVQEDIVRVYRGQFLDHSVSWEERRKQRNRIEVSESEKAAIQRLLAWAKDDNIEIDIRFSAVEALEVACDYAMAGMMGEFDSLLGYFAMVGSKDRPPDPPPKILLPYQTPNPQLEQLDEFGSSQRWISFKQRLQTCLEKICKAKPSEAFDLVSGCLNNPLEELDENFKACCVSLLGKIGRDYQFRSRVLPLIWRGLMDYDSPWVRTKAIGATVEMFSSSTASPPANLVDIIIIHLQDPIVGVHLAALRAVSWRPEWFDERQSLEVLACLAVHLRVYHDNKYQLEDICDGILTIGNRDERFKSFALRMVKSVFPTGEKIVDESIAKRLIHFCKPSDSIAQLVAKDIGTCLALHKRDEYNHYGHSDRPDMFDWLHKLPKATYQGAAEDLLASATKLANRDAWEAFHFASLFANFQMFRYEQRVLETARNALSKEPRNEAFRTDLQQLAMIAAGNAALQVNDAETAEKCFSKIKDRKQCRDRN